MPVPSSFTDISETASSNSPSGAEPVGTQANEYFQAAFSFIRQLYDGVLKPLAAVNWNGQKITNVAAGDTSSTSTDVLTGAQVRNFAYKVGEQRWWNSHGQTIVAVWGPGWQIADGTNGTLDMRNRSPVGTGLTYGLGATVGAIGVALGVGNMPSHTHGIVDPSHTHNFADPGHVHGVNDPGHNHVVVDGGHAHGVNDPGHLHSLAGAIAESGTSAVQEGTGGRTITFFNNPGTTVAATGVSIQAAGTGIHNNASATSIGIAAAATGGSITPVFTGITGTLPAGSGTAFDNRPPLMGVVCIEYTGIGA